MCRSACFAHDGAGVGVQTTAGDGSVNFPNLADGSYRVVVLAPGFAERRRRSRFRRLNR